MNNNMNLDMWRYELDDENNIFLFYIDEYEEIKLAMIPLTNFETQAVYFEDSVEINLRNIIIFYFRSNIYCWGGGSAAN